MAKPKRRVPPPDVTWPIADEPIHAANRPFLHRFVQAKRWTVSDTGYAVSVACGLTLKMGFRGRAGNEWPEPYQPCSRCYGSAEPVRFWCVNCREWFTAPLPEGTWINVCVMCRQIPWQSPMDRLDRGGP